MTKSSMEVGPSEMLAAGLFAPNTAVGSPVYSAAVDTRAATHALFAVAAGAIGTGITVTVEDSDDGSSWADVVPAQTVALTAATGHLVLIDRGMVRRYVRLQFDGGGAGDEAAAVGTPLNCLDTQAWTGAVALHVTKASDVA